MATRRRYQRRRPAARAAAYEGSGDLEKAFYIAVLSFAIVLTGMLARGAAYSLQRPHAVHSDYHSVASGPHEPFGVGRNPVYSRAMVLAARYDSRPYWHGTPLTVGAPASRAIADLAIEHLIPCESGGRVVNRLDSNGKMSYGVLQFQDWREWERISGISGDPDNTDDAIRMAEWGIQHGMIDHWGCAKILGEI